MGRQQACTDFRHRLCHALSDSLDAGQLIQTGTYDLYRDLVLATGMELEKLHEWMGGYTGQSLLPLPHQLCHPITWSCAG